MRSSDMSIPTDIVMKLMGQIFQLGFNVTCENHLTWQSDSLKRSAVLLEQCHNTGSFRRVEKEN